MNVVRQIKAILIADASDYERAMRQAVGATEKLDDAASKLGNRKSSISELDNSLRENSAAWDELGNKATIAGAAGVAAFGLTAKAAIDWESAFAGVKKTIDDSESGYAQLEADLRNLARTLPATHTEIAAVAEAAGQLGVKRGDIIGFTRTMIDLGESTNLSSDEAATAIAQISNVMGTLEREGATGVARFGSALVELGNNGASTERDIVAMATRIAGAAKVVGMSEADLLGVSNALASVGIEAEAGGTAFSKVLVDMSKAASTGSDDLARFARVAGMSAQEFAQKFREDPVEAVAAFTTGLGQIQEAGGDVFTTLSDLGLSEVRVSTALLKMAGSGDMLTDSLQMGRDAWEENSALAEEAGKRYETTAAQLSIAKNNIVDAAIGIGETFVPMIRGASEVAVDLADAWRAVPGPVQTGIAALGATGSVALLSVGGIIKLGTSLVGLHESYKQVAESAPRAHAAMGKAAGLAGAVTAALALREAYVALGDQVAEWRGITISSHEEVAAAILNGADLSKYGQQVEDLTGGWAKFKNGISAFVPVMTVVNGSMRAGAKDFEQFDATLAFFVQSGNADMAADAIERAGISADDAAQYLPQYQTALQAVDNEQKIAAMSAGDMAGGFDEAGGAISEAAEALDRWRAEVAESDASFISLLDGYDAIIEKNREAAEATADATASASDSWRDYYDGFSVAMADYLANLEEQVAAQQAWETNMLILSQSVSQGVLDELARLGPDGAPLVADLVNASDEELARLETVYAQRSDAATNAFASNLQSAGPILAAIMGKAGKDASDRAARELASGEKTLQQVIDQYDLDFVVDADTGAAAASMERLINSYNGRRVVIQTAFSGPAAQYIRPGMVGVNADGGLWDKAGALGMVRAFADGGGIGALGRRFDGSIGAAMPQIRPYTGPAGILWSEEGSGPWEGFVSGHPQKRPRSRRVTEEIAERLGGRVDWFADGGIHSAIAAFASGGVLGSRSNTVAAIDINQLRIFPVAEIADLSKQVRAASTALKPFASAAKTATKSSDAATKARKDAEKDLKDARKAKSSAKTKSAKAARQKEIDAAEKALEKAKKQEAKASEKAKTATDRLTEATRKRADLESDLARAQKELAASARSVAESFASPHMQYRVTRWAGEGPQSGLSGAEAWVQSMTDGAKTLDAFTAQITQLRKLGLDESLVQQIISWGESAGGAVAAEIIEQGKPGAKALNEAGTALEKASEKLGLSAAIGELQLIDAGNSLTTAADRLIAAAAALGGTSTAKKNADGGLWAFADGGGFDSSLGAEWPRLRPYQGPGGLLWSEEGSGPWEAFISGHPQKRARSRRVADETVARLGGRVEWVTTYANGGIRDIRPSTFAASASTVGGGGPVRITGTLDLGDGVMGRLVGMARVVEQFELRAPGILDQAGI